MGFKEVTTCIFDCDLCDLHAEHLEDGFQLETFVVSVVEWDDPYDKGGGTKSWHVCADCAHRVATSIEDLYRVKCPCGATIPRPYRQQGLCVPCQSIRFGGGDDE